MAISMTGFGTASLSRDGWECQVEMRSVNQRFLEVRVKLPHGYASLENELKILLREECHRGKVDCTINLSEGSVNSNQSLVNPQLAQSYARLLEELEHVFGRPIQLGFRDLLAIDGLIQPASNHQEPSFFEDLIRNAFADALVQLQTTRKAEGMLLKADIQDRLKTCGDCLAQIEPIAKQQPGLYYERLKNNLLQLTGSLSFEPESVHREIALFADRCDVTEEITRFQIHLQQMDELLTQPTHIGKKADFFLQELHREINTVSSKSFHSSISQLVITVKAELEKIREQIQNIE